MLKKAMTIVMGLAIVIWIGSLFVWAGVALVASIACAIFQQWELASLFTLGCLCWGYSAVFFARLPLKRSVTDDVSHDADMELVGGSVSLAVRAETLDEFRYPIT